MSEKQRLDELFELEILDTLPEEAYDNLTKLASQICGCKIALITFLDDKRQWFKSSIGLKKEITETARDISFCTHAIEQNDIFEIEDANNNELFKDNPLVTGYPQISFYAGQPLTTSNGNNLGTLCVIDDTPKKLNESQKEHLRQISKVIVNLIEQNRAFIRSKNINAIINRIENSIKGKIGDDFFKTIALEITRNLNANYLIIGDVCDKNILCETTTVVKKNKIIDNFTYELETTPCQHIANGETRYYSEKVQELYPYDELAVKLDVEGYVGVPIEIRGHKNKKSSILVSLYNKKVPDIENHNIIIKHFAEKIKSEKERNSLLLKVKEDQERYRNLFENNEVSIWEQDISELKNEFEKLSKKGIIDIEKYLKENIDYTYKIASKIKTINVNNATLKMFEAESKKDLINNITNAFGKDAIYIFIQILSTIYKGLKNISLEANYKTLKGNQFTGLICFNFNPKGSKYGIVSTSIVNISKQKEAQKELAQSVQNFKNLFENANDPMLLFNPKNGEIINSNLSASELLGYKRNELNNISINDLRLKDHSSILELINIYKIIKLDNSITVSSEIINKKNDIIPVEVSAKIVNYDGQKCVLSIFRDITIRERNQKIQKQLLERLSKAQELSKIGYWEWDIEHDYAIWSDELYKIYGVSKKTFEPSSTNVLDCIVEEDKYIMMNAINQLNNNIDPGSINFRIKRPNGEIRNLRIISVKVNGKIIEGVTQDITEQTEQTIRINKLSKEYLNLKNTIFNHGDILMTDKNGIITNVSKNYSNTLGYSRKEIIGKHTRIFNSGYHTKSEIKMLWDTIQSGQIWHGTFRNKTKQNNIVWIQTTIIPIKNDIGEIIEHMSLRQDITNKKESELQIEIRQNFLNFLNQTQHYLINEKSDVKLDFINHIISKNLNSNRNSIYEIKFENGVMFAKSIKSSIHPKKNSQEYKNIKSMAPNLFEIATKTLNEEVIYVPTHKLDAFMQLSLQENNSHHHLVSGIFVFDQLKYILVNSFKEKPHLENLDSLKTAMNSVGRTIERKIIETQNTESNEKYESVFNSYIDVYYESDLDGNVSIITPSVKNVFGYDPKEIVGKNSKLFYKNPDDRIKLIVELKKYGKALNFNTTLLAKNGKEVQIEAKIYVDQNKIKGVLRDRTEAIKNEEKNNLLSSALDNLSKRILITDKDCKIVHANPSYLFQTENKLEDLIGTKAIALQEEFNKKLSNSEILKEIAKGYKVKHTINFKSPKTGDRIEIMTITPILNNNNLITNYVIVYNDITEEEKSKEELQLIKEDQEKLIISSMLKAQDAERKRISRELHDGLGQLITVVKLKLEVIVNSKKPLTKEEIEEKNELINLLQNIESAGFETKRISYGLLPSVLEDFGLKAGISKIVELSSVNTISKVSFNTNLSGENRFNEQIEVNIYRIIQELMNNSLKHAKAKFIDVDLQLNKKNRTLNLLFNDDGIGFDYKKVKEDKLGNGLINIFERCKVIQAACGLESDLGKGFQFYLRLKL